MKTNPQDILEKIKQDIQTTFRENYLLKKFDLQKDTNKFKTQVNNYLNELAKDGLLVEGKAKKAKLPRKLKKRYKKECVVCLEMYIKPPINYLDFQIEIDEEENENNTNNTI